MTKDKAIAELVRIWNSPHLDLSLKAGLAEAIEALKGEDGDLVSRQALMKHISEEYHEYGEDYDALQILGDIEDFPYAQGGDADMNEVKSPFMQQIPDDGADLISRRDVLNMIIVAGECEPDLGYAHLHDVIEALPSAKPCDKDAILREGLLRSWEELSPRGRTEFDQVIMTIPALPSAEPKTDEESELRFYYVESIDDYWIGQRLDNFYYADWHEGLGFVWSKSRYLPWGEHIVNENTLWKEHTYPSEPIEIPFTEWIKGFVKKYFAEPKTDGVLEQIRWERDMALKTLEEHGIGFAEEPKTGEWIEVEVLPEVYDIEGVKTWGSEMQCDQCGFRHTAIEGRITQYNYCPNCGARMRGEKE